MHEILRSENSFSFAQPAILTCVHCPQWRRNSVPARFLGVQDHIIVRDIPEHKVRDLDRRHAMVK
jgi:hypothetical protein